MKAALVYGSPTPPGRLHSLLDDVEMQLTASEGVTVERIAPTTTKQFVVGEWADKDTAAISQAEVVIFASPVYRGSLTGTLKTLLDLLSIEDLRNKPVGIVTMAAAPHHFLSAERHIRDILNWFGAATVPNSLFFVDKDYETRINSRELREEIAEFSQQLFKYNNALSGSKFGPEPLTLRFQSGSKFPPSA